MNTNEFNHSTKATNSWKLKKYSTINIALSSRLFVTAINAVFRFSFKELNAVVYNIALWIYEVYGPRYRHNLYEVRLNINLYNCKMNIFIDSARLRFNCPRRRIKTTTFDDVFLLSATSTTTPQINDLISWVKKNNRAARAARFLVQCFDEVYRTTTWNFHIRGSDDNASPQQ